MLRCRTLRDRGNTYICALCRHDGAARPSPLTIRSYSSDPKSSSHAPRGLSGGLGGGWSSAASSAIPRRTSGPSHGGWGAPAFGASNASAVNENDSTTSSSNAPTATSSRPAPDDGLLPHERAARQRLAAQRAADAEPPKPAAQPATPHQHQHQHQHRTPPHKQEGLPSLGRRPRQHVGALDDSIGRSRAGPRPVAPIPHRSTPRAAPRAANPMGLDEKPGLRGSLGGLDGPPRSSDPFARLADSAAQRDRERRERKAEKKMQRQLEAAEALEAAGPPKITLPEFINLTNLAYGLKLKPDVLLASLEEMGFENMTLDSIFTGDTAALVAQEFGFEPTVDTGGDRELRPRPEPEDPSSLPPRPPVVTIMGHVDHGKTTLLDYLRKSSVAAQEHGGITQHIGAFVVSMSSGKHITFLDTPGHAAFLTMRQRGAHVTDIVVLVVAADDSVKPQTLEAIKHARAAKVPMIVAINKVDKEDARVDQVKSDLARHGVEIEDFGGDVQVVCVSGKTGQGMDDLEENIATLSEILDVRAEPDGLCEGWVLEASVRQDGKGGDGARQSGGTLRPGDSLVAGTARARVRLLRNEAGVELTEAPPGTPVEILGWRDELTAAGDAVLQAPDEERARRAVEYRTEMRAREASSRQLVEQEARERERKEAEEEADEAAEHGGQGGDAATTGGIKTVTFTVRGDVVGSVEAVCATIQELGNHEVKPRILRSAVGQVSESDVEHAATSGSVIVNFNVAVAPHIKRMAEAAGVRLIAHSVIYHLADEVRQTLSDELADVVSTKVVGEAEVLQIFPINTRGRAFRNIAGCKIRNGLVSRTGMVRVLRKGETVFEGKIDALKHGKKDVTEMRKGTECGISFEGYQDFQVGDQVQTYEEVREKRTL
ncbi:translation initiation factor IF-2 [Verticillium alfalfae VaMs.102]|uniref:Translation initiation factor IF-2, mitochondrial n=1 Tax=Verticillium alfalfae (strain VaMs.102 / ATCC MYA-4576 / FGSC 10136) TaxID=526221 RepID=C9SXW7_VERA1|nr:translation initiation factor IF-2 [Verticillium alfalfae VaMs.102]EEY23632.1 translation initiation factor IF-2 [Verticillium alfalfae VaMs.102]